MLKEHIFFRTRIGFVPPTQLTRESELFPEIKKAALPAAFDFADSTIAQAIRNCSALPLRR
jgi:hypothetical protein